MEKVVELKSKALRSKALISFVAFALLPAMISLSGCSDDESLQKLASLDSRLERVEDKLKQIEKRMEMVSLLETKIEELDSSISELKKPTTPPTTPKTEKARYHEVRQGDNLSLIAQEHGMTVEELCRLNGITPRTIIRPGQMLLVTPGD
jgi:LysM repeat protein